MTEIRPRVTGTEMEWPVGLRMYGDSGYHQANKEQIDRIISRVSPSASNFNGFFENGARCYYDCQMLEYATGEEDTFTGTVAAEIAGEQLVRNALAEYVRRMPGVDDGRLLKRVNHGDGMSCGYHINLCADATVVKLNRDSLHYLGLWAATASMYTGAGCMYMSDGQAEFAVGQKSLGTRQVFDTGTTLASKPLICLRNEPHGDKNRFQRIQVVGLDANISPWASWMMLGTASLCLRAIEQKRRTKKSLQLHSEYSPGGTFAHDRATVRLAHDVARNTDFDAYATLHDGSAISAVDIQWELYKMCARTDHTDEEADALKNWKMALDSIEGDRSFISEKAGWAIKKRTLQRYAAKHDMDTTDKKMLGPDRAYDENRPGGMADKLRSTIWSADMPTAEIIEHRMGNPCPTTRATLRGDAIKNSENYKTTVINWDSYDHSGERRVHLDDPLMIAVPEYVAPVLDDDDDEMPPYWAFDY